MPELLSIAGLQWFVLISVAIPAFSAIRLARFNSRRNGDLFLWSSHPGPHAFLDRYILAIYAEWHHFRNPPESLFYVGHYADHGISYDPSGPHVQSEV